MRAVVVREPAASKAALGEMPKPEPNTGEVMIEVRAVSVNLRR
jgi:NADPH:quinone reductase-like Zn-dependent oxidoreductase